MDNWKFWLCVGRILNWYKSHYVCWRHGCYVNMYIHGCDSRKFLLYVLDGPLVRYSLFVPKDHVLCMCQRCIDEIIPMSRYEETRQVT